MKRLRNTLFILLSLVLIVLTVDALVDLEFVNEIQQSLGDIAVVDTSQMPKISKPDKIHKLSIYAIFA